MTTLEPNALRVRSLDEDGVSESLYGSKAATLARLRKAGVAVPPGVVIPALAFTSVLERLLIAQGLSLTDSTEKAAPFAAELSVPAEILEEVMAVLDKTRISGGRFAVRSSAVGEDTQSASFAGQLESVVDVSRNELSAAIRSVWASSFHKRALHYRRRAGLALAGSLPVGVIVQRFLEPERAGVMFTGSPTLAGDDVITIEAVAGRGGALVDGSMVPMRYYVRGSTTEKEGPETAAIDDSTLGQLLTLATDVEKALNARPLDIEWISCEGAQWIVQARPITTQVTASATVRHFACRVTPIDSHHSASIPLSLAAKDKFRLRLIASRESLPISRGWLLTCNQGEGQTIDDAARGIASAAGENQVSIVLQRPARFEGEILRRFSPLSDLSSVLRKLIAVVGAREDAFDFIVTEVYRAEQSGIARMVDGRLYIEVGFGSYIPKGVVPTSLYVFNGAERVHAAPVFQESAVVIEDGAPVERSVQRTAEVSIAQASALTKMTQAVIDDYGDVSVEFGIRPTGECYLIDIIPERVGDLTGDSRVMSPGVADGYVTFADSEDLLARSLEAHFHSERSGRTGQGDGRIIVAPRPFLALEEYLVHQEDGRLAFIFESGSLLGHLAIILREHRVPAIVVPGAREVFTDGQRVRVDTSTERLFDQIGRSNA